MSRHTKNSTSNNPTQVKGKSKPNKGQVKQVSTVTSKTITGETTPDTDASQDVEFEKKPEEPIKKSKANGTNEDTKKLNGIELPLLASDLDSIVDVLKVLSRFARYVKPNFHEEKALAFARTIIKDHEIDKSKLSIHLSKLSNKSEDQFDDASAISYKCVSQGLEHLQGDSAYGSDVLFNDDSDFDFSLDEFVKFPKDGFKFTVPSQLSGVDEVVKSGKDLPTASDSNKNNIVIEDSQVGRKTESNTTNIQERNTSDPEPMDVNKAPEQPDYSHMVNGSNHPQFTHSVQPSYPPPPSTTPYNPYHTNMHHYSIPPQQMGSPNQMQNYGISHPQADFGHYPYNHPGYTGHQMVNQHPGYVYPQHPYQAYPNSTQMHNGMYASHMTSQYGSVPYNTGAYPYSGHNQHPIQHQLPIQSPHQSQMVTNSMSSNGPISVNVRQPVKVTITNPNKTTNGTNNNVNNNKGSNDSQGH